MLVKTLEQSLLTEFCNSQINETRAGFMNDKNMRGVNFPLACQYIVKSKKTNCLWIAKMAIT